MKRFLFLLTLSILCVAGITGHAQIFPIQSQVNLTPPYSGNLSDYTFPGSQRITVTLNCNDITISNYRVKLRFTIEGLGITVRSKPNVSFEPFIIDGASPLLLYGDGLNGDYLAFKLLSPQYVHVLRANLGRMSYSHISKLCFNLFIDLQLRKSSLPPPFEFSSAFFPVHVLEIWQEPSKNIIEC